jgi:hypothetical protein
MDLGRARDGLLVPEGLTWTRVVVEAHELDDEFAKMLFAEDEDVVESLATERANKSFSERFMSGARGAGERGERGGADLALCHIGHLQPPPASRRGG